MTMKNKEINELAKEYAINCHEDTNHLYDGYPYRVHLQLVVTIAKQFIHLIPENERGNVQASCWVHDVIEDCRQTYNDVKAATNEKVADLAYALTNEKGRNRKERANDKYYLGIISTPYATFVKVCDRIANMKHSKNVGSKMFDMYKKENPAFINILYHKDYDELFAYLTNLAEDDD